MKAKGANASMLAQSVRNSRPGMLIGFCGVVIFPLVQKEHGPATACAVAETTTFATKLIRRIMIDVEFREEDISELIAVNKWML